MASPALSRQHSSASLRPTPPPKPAHLTLSLRARQAQTGYPAMPRWSQHSSRVHAEDDTASIAEEDEGELPSAGGSRLHAQPGGGGALRREFSSGGSTLRPAREPAVQGTRLSIMFDSARDNPLAVGHAKGRSAGGTLGRVQAEKALEEQAREPPEDEPAEGTDEEDGGSEGQETMLDLTNDSRAAVATHDFAGEAAFGELSFALGTELVVECDDLGSDGGWALGYIATAGEAGRGLIPRGWYEYPDPPPMEVNEETAPVPSAAPEPATTHSAPRPRSTSPPLSKAVNGLRVVPDSLTSPAGTPSYCVRSIGRNVVVSGVEFVPTHPSALHSSAAQTRTNLAWSTDFDPSVIVSDLTTSAALAEEDGSPADDDGGDRLAELLPPASTFTSRLSLTDSRASLGFRDADIPRRAPEEDAAGTQAKTASAPGASFITRFGAGTLARGYNALAGLALAERSDPLGALKPANELERWILKATKTMQLGQNAEGQLASQRMFRIEAGPAWSAAQPAAARSGTIYCHSPEARSVPDGAMYVVYHISTDAEGDDAGYQDADEAESEGDSLRWSTSHPRRDTVERRFSDFCEIHQTLSQRYLALVVPELPAKSVLARSNDAFVESRRRDLERWLARIGRHPVLGTAVEFQAFVGLDQHDGEACAFLDSVLHPDFNVDPRDALELVDRFERHAKAGEVGGGHRAVEDAVGGLRTALSETASKMQQVASSLVRLAAGQALPPPALDAGFGIQTTPKSRARAWCVQGKDGGFSFREEDDPYGLSVAKAVQAAGEALAEVGLLYDAHARGRLLSIQELLRENTHPHTQHLALIAAHRSALKLHEALAAMPLSEEASEALARADTALNLTSAELDRAHRERQQDLKHAAEHLLDAQIALHRDALEQLEWARTHFEPGLFGALAQAGPRLPSALEAAPPAGTAAAEPLPAPSSYGVPRGVGAGLAEGVGSVLFRRPSQVTRAGGGSLNSGPVAGTVGSLSAAKLLVAQSRMGAAGWRNSVASSDGTQAGEGVDA